MTLTPEERLHHWLAHKLPAAAYNKISLRFRIMLIRNQNSINSALAAKYKD